MMHNAFVREGEGVGGDFANSLILFFGRNSLILLGGVEIENRECKKIPF